MNRFVLLATLFMVSVNASDLSAQLTVDEEVVARIDSFFLNLKAKNVDGAFVILEGMRPQQPQDIHETKQLKNKFMLDREILGDLLGMGVSCRGRFVEENRVVALRLLL